MDDLVQRLRQPHSNENEFEEVHYFLPVSIGEEAAARITALEAENRELRHLIGVSGQHYENVEAELADERAENERLREALEPFAEAAQGLDPSDKDGWLMWEHPQANAVSVGDFRRAAAALEPRG